MGDRERVPVPSRGLRSRSSSVLGPFDWFVLCNLSIFLAAAGSVFLKRFIRYRGEEHLGEFGIYAVVSVVVILAVWRTLRRHDWPLWLLLAMEVAILAHFAGGLVQTGDGRLYDLVLFEVRFDKVVHVFNSFVAALVVSRVSRCRGPAVVLMVLGLGALWEIVEYAVVSRVPDAGVGLYANNLQDLVANLIGSLAWWGCSTLRGASVRVTPTDGPAKDTDGA
jgi:hypothetical protein